MRTTANSAVFCRVDDYGGHMTAHAVTAPPANPPLRDEARDDLPSVVTVRLRGRAATAAIEGARLTHRSNGDFVIDATLALKALSEWEAAGFSIVAKAPNGQEFPLTPVVMGLAPASLAV